MAVPYSFGSATSAIPLSQLDSNFATTITLGNTAIQLGNTVTTLNNMTLANVAISSGSVTLTSASVTNANVTSTLTLDGGTANGVAYLNGSKVLTTGSALVFDGSNLGLGVTPSAWATFKSITVGDYGASLASAGDDSFFSSNTYYNGGFKFQGAASAYASLYRQKSGVHSWLTSTAAGTAGNAITFTQAMTLDASGNFLVGTTSQIGGSRINFAQPTASTDMKIGVSVATGTNAAYQVFVNNTVTTIGTENSSGGSLVSGSGAYSTVIANSGAYPLSFGTNNTERARIDSSGRLLVNNTTAASDLSSSVQFAVYGTGYTGLFKGTTASSTVINSWNSATTGNNQFVEFFTEAAVTSRGSITYNRGAGLVAYNTTSDYRSKNIYGPITDSGFVIDSTPVYMGKMKGATQERPMFIAHETPDYAHTGEKDAVDKDGNPVYQQMDASALVPVMWAEIQSLRQRLAAAGI